MLPSTLLLRGKGTAPAAMLARLEQAFATEPATRPKKTCGFRVGRHGAPAQAHRDPAGDGLQAVPE
ncbi:MAG: hypothetical protein KatS3mg103_0285 [Phycisphaerales bacterium]|nr:MAG: hypothetical protein KatS3mg103_0285 [Phycisphaerales bacterium]